jgi:HD-GYP domain-containing protein (c-di-GMP phosphodiesterase class II)
LIASITQMTRHALNAIASSLLLIDEEKQELIFKFADGPVGKQLRLRRLPITGQSGIAGWVARNSKPTIVNDVSRDPRFNRSVDELTDFVTRAIICVPLILHHKVIGVIEVLNKANGSEFNKQDLQILLAVAATAALAMENVRLNDSLLNAYKSTVNALVSLADAKEANGGGHSRRVAEYALMGATELALSANERQTIEYAAILHDVGRLGIPDSILNKAEPPTDEEWKIIQKHPVTGYNLLKGIPFLKEASRLILYHHERYDGKGYPLGLKGEAIPLGARLIAVADAFDNMTTGHPYRAALGVQHAFNELRRCARTQFCPVAVKAFSAGFAKSRLSGKF